MAGLAPGEDRLLPGLSQDAGLSPPTNPGVRAKLDRRTSLARGVVRVLCASMPDPSPLDIVLHEDTEERRERGSLGRGFARIRLVIHGPDVLAHLLFPPSANAFADAYLRGDLDIEGDVTTAVAAAASMDLRRLRATEMRRLLHWGIELWRGAPAPRPLARVASLGGRRHSRARDMAAVRFHYDVGEAFYESWLDRRLTYSCGYFPDGTTDSDEANTRLRDAGKSHLARTEVRDYRDLAALGSFDIVASVGMFEHVGQAQLPAYFGAAYEALQPGGLFLNHGIATARRLGSRRRRGGLPSPGRFVERYVFPDGELVTIEEAVRVARDAGFEVVDVRSLRPHYALTLAAWVARLEDGWPAAVAAGGEEVARTWRLYLSAARLGFEQGDLEVYQTLLAKPVAPGVPAKLPLRPWW